MYCDGPCIISLSFSRQNIDIIIFNQYMKSRIAGNTNSMRYQYRYELFNLCDRGCIVGCQHGIELFILSFYWYISTLKGKCYATSQNDITLRVDSRLAPSKWETSLQSNAVSHWLGVNLESSLILINYTALSNVQSGMHHDSPGCVRCVIYGCYRITV